MSDSQGSSVCGLDSLGIDLWLRRSCENLNHVAETLNQANVFPVADADTGTNMLLTMRGAAAQAQSMADHHDARTTLRYGALGALTHARGNSGIILSEYVRGFYRATIHPDFAHLNAAAQLVQALTTAADNAYDAVAQPVEGTILTAARAAALGAQSWLESQSQLNHSPLNVQESLVGVISSAIEQAVAAFEQSHTQLSVLARAGVLDAGAYGLVVILISLRSVLENDTDATTQQFQQSLRLSSANSPETAHEGLHPDTRYELPSRKPDGEFELMCLISIAEPSGITGLPGIAELSGNAEPSGSAELSGNAESSGTTELSQAELVASNGSRADQLITTAGAQQASDAHEANSEAHYAQFAQSLRSVLGSVGESVVVVGGDQPDGGALWNLHVHTDAPEKALEELGKQCRVYQRQYGVVTELSNIVVRNLTVQLAENAREPHAGSAGSVRLVVCCSSPRLALDIARAGAVVCIDGDAPVTVSGVERALTEVHTIAGAGHGRPFELASSVEHPKPQSEAHPQEHPQEQAQPHKQSQSEAEALVISHSTALTQELQTSGLAPFVVQATDDAQVVAATSAVVEQWESGPHQSIEQLMQVARECLVRLHTERIEPATRETVTPIVNLIRNNPESIPIVTILVDAQCSVPLVTDLCDGIERAQSDAEIIVLESGRTGTGLTVSIEWVQY